MQMHKPEPEQGCSLDGLPVGDYVWLFITYTYKCYEGKLYFMES